jgi:hypothetical protein
VSRHWRITPKVRLGWVLFGHEEFFAQDHFQGPPTFAGFPPLEAELNTVFAREALRIPWEVGTRERNLFVKASLGSNHNGNVGPACYAIEANDSRPYG